jgi:hypothetical protein
MVASFRTVRRALVSCACVSAPCGCGTMENGRRWADDATLLPSAERLGTAALDALTAPATWLPLAGAAVLQIDDWDGRISDWAVKTTPIFGSNQDAEDAVGWTGTLSDSLFYASVAVTPSGDEAGGWFVDKAKGLAVGMGARVATIVTTDLLKDATGRTRPNGTDDKSMPSQHASGTAVDATLTVRNVGATTWPVPVKYAVDTGVVGLAALSSWSRVEAGAHFPSDVLVGTALGHFLGRFFDEAFLRLPEGVALEPLLSNDVYGLTLTFRF